MEIQTIPEVDQTRQGGERRKLICRIAVKGKGKERLPHVPYSYILKLGRHSVHLIKSKEGPGDCKFSKGFSQLMKPVSRSSY